MSKNKPKILELYNLDESHAKYLENIHSSFKLKCKLCNQYISASIRVTSNWISHYKYTHIDEYKTFTSAKNIRPVSISIICTLSLLYNQLFWLIFKGQQNYESFHP